MKLCTSSRQCLVLPAVRPNEGLQAKYRKELDKLIAEMQKSLVYWLRAAYRANPPELAMDSSPASVLKSVMNRLGLRWRRRFNQAAPELAKYFAQSMARRSDAQLKAILSRAGFSVPFTMTREMNDVMQATINEQVGLIKSIAQRHLNDVEGLVMRSVSQGRDLGTLTKELRERYGVTKRRAALIARDQNNKATATITRVRQEGMGLFKARWRHSHAGREPRPTHVKNDGRVYDVRTGWYDPAVGKYIWPGVEINCRCTSETIIPGFDS